MECHLICTLLGLALVGQGLVASYKVGYYEHALRELGQDIREVKNITLFKIIRRFLS